VEALPDYLKPLATLTRPFPHEAVVAAIERRKESVPHLLAALERVANHPEEFIGDPDAILHEFALYLLAQFRETRAIRPSLVIARHPRVDDLLGDLITGGLGPILASVAGGDPMPIQSLVEDEKAEEFARGAGIEALGAMSRHGLWPESVFASYLSQLYTVRLERKPSHVWDALISVSADFAMGEHLELIRDVFEEGLADPGYDTFKNVSAMIRSGSRTNLETCANYRLIDDAIGEMSCWYCFDEAEEDDGDENSHPEISHVFSPPPPDLSPVSSESLVIRTPFRRTEPKIGRNEPCPCGSGKKYKKCCGQS
jgi:hypothetical protein